MPIVPNFARTAYSLQGWTLPAGKLDLNLSKNTDPVTGYVALSRFKRADDVLILQPFSLDIFQQGAPEQPEILLLYLNPAKQEEACQRIKELHARLEDKVLQQKQKANEARTANLPLEHELSKEQAQRKHNRKRQTWECFTCGQEKDYTGYSISRWKKKKTCVQRITCLDCEDRQQQELVQCSVCRKQKTQEAYSKSHWKNRKRAKNLPCTDCEKNQQMNRT